MSVQSEINRISSNVTAALAAIADKGVTVPDGSNSDSLAALIAAIEAGGGEYPVPWIKGVSAGTITPSEDARTLNIHVGGELSVLTGLILGVRHGTVTGSYIKGVYFINVNQVSETSTLSGLIYGSSRGQISVSVSNGDIVLRSSTASLFLSGVTYAYVAIWRS